VRQKGSRLFTEGKGRIRSPSEESEICLNSRTYHDPSVTASQCREARRDTASPPAPTVHFGYEVHTSGAASVHFGYEVHAPEPGLQG